MSVAVVHRIAVHRLSIPLRVRHAAPERTTADPTVVEIEFTNGTTGFGEVPPQRCATGEAHESFIDAVRSVFAPALLCFHPESFPEALEALDSLPWENAEGGLIPRSRAGIELAVLDAAMRHFGRTADDIVQWLGVGGFGRPGCLRQIRYSGVLALGGLAATMRQLRLMYWGGLRDFKLELGPPGDRERARRAAHFLARPIAAGRATLRVDANGAWTLEEAAGWLAATSDVAIAALEQPLPRGEEIRLVELRKRFPVPIVHDESLVTEDDARRLVALGVGEVFNIHIGKCGGFLPSLRLGALARKHNVRIVLGGRVGETSILSAAGLRFLEVCPAVSWAEGCFGSFPRRGDIVAKGLRFSLAGRPPQLVGPGWGVRVDGRRLEEFAVAEPDVFHL